MTTQHTIILKGESYPYTLKKHTDGTTTFVCKSALLNQKFADEDIAETISLLAEYIQLATVRAMKQDAVVRFRIGGKDRLRIEKRAKAENKTISAYLRERALA
jgi:hypothetical protein